MNDHFLNLHEVILIVTIVETLFLAIYFKFVPGKQAQARSILACFFLLVAGTLMTTLITWNVYLQSMAIAHWSFIPLILSCCLLLQGPTLFVYLRALSQPIDIWRWKNAIHLFPALFVSGVVVVFNIRVIDWLPWNWPQLSWVDRSAVKLIWAIVRCTPLVYVFACFYAEYRLRQQQKQVYSMISADELRWAEIVLGGFFIHWLWSFVGYFIGEYLSGEMNGLIGTLNNYLTVILVNVLFAFGLLNSRQQIISAPVEENTKAADVTQLDEKVRAIEKAIHERKIYLESQINLERFAEQIGLRARDVSSIINSHYHSNFFEFINGYRIEEAKRLLHSIEHKDDTILDIIYKSGFNSQSAFHRFFKRLVGVTPSEYRHQQRVTTVNIDSAL